MIGSHARSSGQTAGERKALPRIREYARRCYPAAPFDHRIGIKRGFGDTGRAPFRLIALVNAGNLLMENANGESRLTAMSCVARSYRVDQVSARRKEAV